MLHRTAQSFAQTVNPHRKARLIQTSSRSASAFMAPLLSLLLWGGVSLRPVPVQAETPETVPAQVKATIAQIDAAASSRNLEAVLQFYSPTFTHSDGLTIQSLQQSLTQLWKRYPKLTYRTELKSWKPDGSAIVVETVTTINGVQMVEGKDTTLTSTLRSEQRFEGQKIVRQNVLAERTLVTSGAKPPTVELFLPEQVNVGQPYSFDAIVKEPLGNSLLLGAAVEEPIRVNSYLNPASVNLELLPTGGLFKVGRAPSTADSRWLSAIVVRADGTTLITQRLRVVEPGR